MKNKHHYVAIMAGGIGSRFWPKSRTAYPKQFLEHGQIADSMDLRTLSCLYSQ